MSQQNVEVVRRANRFWIERDFSQISELLDPEVVIDLSRNVFNPDVYRGYDGVNRYVEAVDEMWDRFEAKIEEVIDAGDTVVTATRISGVGRGSGVQVEMQLFQVVILRDGRILQLTGGYRNRAEALEAAGLDPSA
jgi:ketosteroid isomerase-like protein